MRKFLSAFTKDEQGASAVEYAILIALITGVMVGAVQILGTNISTEFTAIGKLI